MTFTKAMKIIKRDGSEAKFDIQKIIVAVSKANESVAPEIRMTELQIRRIAEAVTIACEELGRSPSVEEVQDLVEKQIMAHGAFEVAKAYITYRYNRALIRHANTTDDKILTLIDLVQDGSLDIEIAAAKANMTVDEFKEAMNNAPLQAV